MSYFPSPNLEKLYSNKRNSSLYTCTSYPQDESDVTPTDVGVTRPSQPHSYLDSDLDAWDSSEPRGLGLMPINCTMGSLSHPPYTTSADPTPLVFSWSPEVAPSQPSSRINTDAMRTNTYNNQHTPPSTIVPTVTFWETQSVPATDVIPHTSPGQSDYSASTSASTFSSPFIANDTYFRTAGSPIVKIESPAEPNESPLQYPSHATSFEQCGLVKPSDIFTRPANSTSFITTSSLKAPTAPVSVRIATSTHSPQAQCRRAHSTESRKLQLTERRRKRGFTKLETANYTCDTCGKPFQRSYNLRAHMETHNPNRVPTHVCAYSECQKRFARKTDLTRHESSVHLKVKDFVCPLCDCCFSRKDTLRRHIDDGCPKRPEVRSRTPKPHRHQAPNLARRSSIQHFGGDGGGGGGGGEGHSDSNISTTLRQALLFNS